MKAKLFGAIEGDQGSDGDEAAIALGQAGPFPDVSEEDVLGEFRSLGAKSASNPLTTA